MDFLKKSWKSLSVLVFFVIVFCFLEYNIFIRFGTDLLGFLLGLVNIAFFSTIAYTAICFVEKKKPDYSTWNKF